MNDYSKELVDKIRKLVDNHPNSYARILSSRESTGLLSEINSALPMLSDRKYSIKTKIWWILNGIETFPVCLQCGQPMENINICRLSRGYPKYCSDKCMHSSQKYIDSIRNTIQEKYGVENAFQIKSVIDDRVRNKKNIYGKARITRRKSRTEEMYVLHGIDAFNAYRNYEFPYIDLPDSSLRYELNRLNTEQTKDQTPSRIIRALHRTMYSCRRRGMISPREYWKSFKSQNMFDSGKWKKFYCNRFVHAESKDAETFRKTGIMPAKMILDGFTITHAADCVSYFKPMLAKRLIQKYAGDASEIFCPFNGFSGIMLGATVGCGKKFIGQDLNAELISESQTIINVVKSVGYDIDAAVSVQDVFNSNGQYDVLVCCPPYEDIEQWNFDGEMNCVDKNLPCFKWIDICLDRFKCRKYIFVVDDLTVGKYIDNVVEKIENRSHFGTNFEYVVVID